VISPSRLPSHAVSISSHALQNKWRVNNPFGKFLVELTQTLVCKSTSSFARHMRWCGTKNAICRHWDGPEKSRSMLTNFVPGCSRQLDQRESRRVLQLEAALQQSRWARHFRGIDRSGHPGYRSTVIERAIPRLRPTTWIGTDTIFNSHETKVLSRAANCRLTPLSLRYYGIFSLIFI